METPLPWTPSFCIQIQHKGLTGILNLTWPHRTLDFFQPHPKPPSTTPHILHLHKLCQHEQLPLILLFPFPPATPYIQSILWTLPTNASKSILFSPLSLLSSSTPIPPSFPHWPTRSVPHHTTAALHSWASSIFHTTATHVLPLLTCKCKASLMVLFAVLQCLPFAVQLKSQYLYPPCKAVTCSAILRPLILVAAHFLQSRWPF